MRLRGRGVAAPPTWTPDREIERPAVRSAAAERRTWSAGRKGTWFIPRPAGKTTTVRASSRSLSVRLSVQSLRLAPRGKGWASSGGKARPSTGVGGYAREVSIAFHGSGETSVRCVIVDECSMGTRYGRADSPGWGVWRSCGRLGQLPSVGRAMFLAIWQHRSLRG